jgi:PmbA protein
MNDREKALYALEALKSAGADKAQVALMSEEKHELNVDSGSLSLMRTGFNTAMRFAAIAGGRRGTASLNGGDKEAIDRAAAEAVGAAMASPEDPAYDISPAQPQAVFERGPSAPDPDLMYDRLSGLLESLRLRYPSLKLMQSVLSFNRRAGCFLNSNGVDLAYNSGFYNGSVFFISKDGGRTSSFNYSDFNANALDREMTDMSLIGELFRQSGEQLDTKPLSGKFTGDIIVTPHALQTFLMYLTWMSLRDAALISGSSPYKDKLGQRIASPGFTLRSTPADPGMAGAYSVTNDGYAAENVTLIEDGVLKTFVLSQYAANKTGLPRVSNDCGCEVIEPGDKTLEELAAPIKRGLLVTRVSGNNPTAGGDFSGVAKNSYYVENGKILYPVSETMISCNIGKMLLNINGISRERVDFGNALLPWISFGGVTVSGK